MPGPLLILGHSVGGQLALLSARGCGADAVAGVLALAPVTDVLTTLREGLGDDAAVSLFADVDGDHELAARDASPLFSLPIGVPMSIIHGLNDARVPHEHSQRFRSEAYAVGDQLRLSSPEELEHRAAIDPAGEHWATVMAELGRLAFGAD